MSFQIDCIVKADRYNPFEAIQTVGGPNPGGRRWQLSQQEVIHWIDDLGKSFHVESRHGRVRVVTATSPHGNRYIKTEADGKEPNNLLELTSCTLR